MTTQVVQFPEPVARLNNLLERLHVDIHPEGSDTGSGYYAVRVEKCRTPVATKGEGYVVLLGYYEAGGYSWGERRKRCHAALLQFCHNYLLMGDDFIVWREVGTRGAPTGYPSVAFNERMLEQLERAAGNVAQPVQPLPTPTEHSGGTMVGGYHDARMQGRADAAETYHALQDVDNDFGLALARLIKLASRMDRFIPALTEETQKWQSARLLNNEEFNALLDETGDDE